SVQTRLTFDAQVAPEIEPPYPLMRDPRLPIGKRIAAGKLLVHFYNFWVARDFSDRGLIVFRIDRRGIITDSFLVFFFKLGVIIGLAKCRLKNLRSIFRCPRTDEVG